MNTTEFIEEENHCYSIPDIEMTISQFDYHDCEISRYTGTFTTIFDNIPNFGKYYYRVTALGRSDSQKRVSGEHFGIKTTSIGGLKLSEESYLNSYLNYIVYEYAKQKERDSQIPIDCNFSFVLIHDFWFIDRMRTVKQNSFEGFNAALDSFINKYSEFQKLENLNNVKGKNGIYLLVLDEYNVCYLGQSNDLRKRIMRHWSRNDYFSGTGLDMFKAKDTTRIYVALTESKHKTNALEHRVIRDMPSRYTLNCLAGGDIDYLENNNLSILKPSCPDNDFVNYVVQNYNITERINANKDRFIITE